MDIKRGVYYVAPDSADIAENHEYTPAALPREFDLTYWRISPPRVVAAPEPSAITRFRNGKLARRHPVFSLRLHPLSHAPYAVPA